MGVSHGPLVGVGCLEACGTDNNYCRAGTAAAAAQAAIGNVVAHSLFATCTSAAAGGYGAAVIASAAQVAGGVTAGVAGVAAAVAKAAE